MDGTAVCGSVGLNGRVAVNVSGNGGRNLSTSVAPVSSAERCVPHGATPLQLMAANPGVYLRVAFAQLWGIILQF